MSLKKTNGVGLKTGKNNTRLSTCTYILHRWQKTWLFSSIGEQLFWPTLLESKCCLQIPLRRFITCVMTDRGRKKLASLILYTKHMLKSTYKIPLLFTSNRIAKHSFRFYTFTPKVVPENLQYNFLLKADCVLYSFFINIKWCIINATKERISLYS